MTLPVAANRLRARLAAGSTLVPAGVDGPILDMKHVAAGPEALDMARSSTAPPRAMMDST